MLKGTLWDFLNIHSVAKYQKLMGGTILKKFGKKSVSVPKKEESLSVEKSGPFCFGMAFYHVRGFGCVENEVLSTYGKSW